MIPAIKNAVREHGVDTAQASKYDSKLIPHSRALQEIKAAPESKAFAMFLFNIGATDLERTEEAFDQHPKWRHA